MKKLLIIFFILFSINGYSQNTVPQFLGGKNSNLIIQGILNLADSAKASMNWLLSDTNTTKSNFSSNLKGRWARQGGRLYYNPTGTRFIFADSVTSSTTIDTTSLSNRIDARVKYTDTAAMLNPYARKTLVADTAAAIRSSIPNVSGKVNYTDTATMLVPYLRKADTVSLSNRINLKLNTSDTSAMLSPYYRSATATAALALKQNYTDTTTWDATKKNLADTALALRALIPTSIDTTSLSNRIDARVKYTDTASMLVGYVRAARLNDTASAIRSSIPNVSGKVNYTDTSAMLTPYLRKGDTTAMLLPYARKTLVADTAAAIRASIPNVSGKVNYTDTASMLAPYATDAQVALKLNIADTANMRIRPIAGSNMTITGTYPNVTFAASSGTTIDTTSLSNRIDARVKYTDTAAMLGGYLRKVDTSTLSNRINAKLSIADTASMLTNYARKTLVNDTAAAIRAAIPNVSGKVNYTDTASMLSPYLRSALGVKYADTASMLGGYLRKVDTASLSNRINLKFNTADTANNWVNSVVKLNDSTIRVTQNTTITDITLTPTSTVTSATRLITAVYNKSGATITRGSVVYINGAHSSVLPSIALAKANTESTSAYTYGLVENDIPNNSQGVVIQVGVITNLNLPTSTYTDGQTLYLSPTVAGGYTLVKPLAPNHYVSIGTITRAHPTLGTIQIAIRNGFQLDELSDVQIPLVPNDSDLLQFTRVDSLWKNVSVTTAIGNKYIKPSDTAAMLSPYLRKVDTASLSTRINTKLNSADTASLSNRINLKLNSADTASLSTRIEERVKYTDTATMLSPYYRTATATAALATKVNYTDTATMLTPYLRKGDTATMLGGYLRKVDTASLSNRIDAKVGYGTLTTNYVPKATSTTAIGNSQIFDNGTSVGIGTATPSASFKLDINGGLKILGNSSFNGGTSSRFSTQIFNTLTDQFHQTVFEANSTNGQFNFRTNSGSQHVSGAGAIVNIDGRLVGGGAVNNTQNGLNVISSYDPYGGGSSIPITLSANTNLAAGTNTTGNGVFTTGTVTGNGAGTLYGLRSQLSNTSTGNVTLYGLYVSATGATNNFGVYSNAGRNYFANQIGVGIINPNASSILDLTSTTQGLGLPSMTTTQQNAIATPRTGLEIYNSTLLSPHFYNGSVWTGAWNKRGNSGTTAGTDFIGTTDGVDVVFKRANVTAGWLSGTSNASFGVSSMPLTTTTGGSAAFGHSALSALTSGLYNNAFGWRALMNCTTGRENTAIGDQTLMTLTTGNYNVGIGTLTLQNNNGNYNTGVGYRALLSNTTGGGNCAFGPQAAINNKTGSNNAAFGYAALASDTTASSNSAFGTQALFKTVGAQNTGIGNAAAYYSTSGNNNTSVGHYSSFNLSTGENNTTLGTWAGQYLYASSNNVYLGYGAGDYYLHNAGDKNLLVGYRAFPAVYTGSNQLNLGNVLWGSGCSGTGQTAAGSLSVGVTAPNASALLDLTSTTKGFLPPRMTATQAAAIATPAEGLMVYVTNTGGVFTGKGWWGWNGAAWEKLNP
jgi:hypothetical protein